MRRRMAITCAWLLLASMCFAESEKAPDFNSDAEWLDSGGKVPHSIKGYRGRVLLVDFWEYTCINCIRDVSILKRWYTKYHPFGFEIVGVHYGEFAMGYKVDNVRRAAKRLQLPWPVVADIHGSIWNAYKSRVWPNRFLIDQNGKIVLHVEGEAGNREMELKIRELLEPEHPQISKIPEEPSENTFAPQCGSVTDETYVGDWLGRGALENPQHHQDGSVVDFKPLQEPQDGRVMLAGKWQTDREGVTSADKQGGTASLRYHARSVYAVLSVENPKNPIRLYVQQDGKPLTTDDAGADVKFDSLGSYIEVREPRMYYVINNRSLGSHLLVLTAQARGLALHSFTYGNDCQQDFEAL
jgi:thiol-disulfide isomerase/thioredoxin